MLREIHPDIIENTILTGKMTRHGRYCVKFTGKKVICVGELQGNVLKIFTVEKQ